MKIRDGYVVKNVAGTHLVVNVSDDIVCDSAMIQLNETGILLWEKLSVGAEKDDLVSLLLEEYDVARDVAVRDVDAFLALLQKAGVFA